MNVEGFFINDFDFIHDDGHTKTFTHKDFKVLFVKQWLDLVPNDSIENLDGGSERMYYDLSPYILVKTIIDNEYIEIPLVEYSLEGSKELYDKITKTECAIILTGMHVLLDKNN